MSMSSPLVSGGHVFSVACEMDEYDFNSWPSLKIHTGRQTWASSSWESENGGLLGSQHNYKSSSFTSLNLLGKCPPFKSFLGGIVWTDSWAWAHSVMFSSWVLLKLASCLLVKEWDPVSDCSCCLCMSQIGWSIPYIHICVSNNSQVDSFSEIEVAWYDL